VSDTTGGATCTTACNINLHTNNQSETAIGELSLQTFQKASMSQHLSEQEIIRREKLKELQALGIDPYPAALYPVSHYSADIKQNFSEETKDAFADVCVAGRIMSTNDKGKVFL